MTGTDLCVNKSQFVPVIFEPPCIYTFLFYVSLSATCSALIEPSSGKQNSINYTLRKSLLFYWRLKGKRKDIPVQARRVWKDSRRLRLPGYSGSWYMKVSFLRIGRLYPHWRFLVVICVKGWVDTRAKNAAGRMKSMKIFKDSVEFNRDVTQTQTVVVLETLASSEVILYI